METECYDETMASRVALHPFLAGMNRGQLVLLADCAVSVRFAPGDIILREGDHADRVYLIETGRVILESGKGHGKPVVVDTIGAGDLLGWSWMFPPYSWQFTARAVEPTRAIFFTGPVLREYCERDHSLGFELLKRLTAVMNRRMQNARRKMLDVHSGKTALEPVVLQPPFLDQELDTYPGIAANETREQGD
jgi:CRP/FNR family transcriptional regulator, cyclic AMP receptor protein